MDYFDLNFCIEKMKNVWQFRFQWMKHTCIFADRISFSVIKTDLQLEKERKIKNVPALNGIFMFS